jgi:1-acyl-sn-glycerol-3-phosphate acyltransferase
MIYLRSFLFFLGQAALTPLFGILALLILPLGLPARYGVISHWAKWVESWLQLTCGLNYRVVGAEHVPADKPTVILAKHQSAWETIAFQKILPPHVWVLKRELLRIPFFGWGLAVLKPVAIDRAAGKKALRQVVDQGKARLADGMSVMVFPEGTRMKPGQKGSYHIGGAWLASQTGTPVLPVAHNAGEFWGKNSFLRRPGTITVSIGPLIDTAGLKADEVNRRAEAWIEAEMERIAAGEA